MLYEMFIVSLGRFSWIARLVVMVSLYLAILVASGSSQVDRVSINTRAGQKVDRFIRQKMATEQIPGVQIAVVQNGKILKIGSYGFSNLELNTPVTSETMFEIASNSKQFTAGAILLLCEDKKLGLDDSVTKYLRGLPPEYDPVTIRQLLDHTSGVKDYIEEFQLERRLDYTNEQLVEHIGANKLNFLPSENARYSTTGYLLLGLVIEKITGKPYADFLSERIFKPLGMKHTRVISLADIIPGRATGYILEKGKLRHGRYVAQTLRSSADIGMMTTASDMAKWDLALNGTNLFDRKSLDVMFNPGRLSNGDLARNDWNGYFGAGWFVDDYLGNREINHGGTLITGFHCNISKFIDKDLTVIVLTNRLRSNPSMLGYSIAGFYDASLRPPHLMDAKRDCDTQRTEGLRDLLLKVADGSDVGPWITTGFRSWLSSENGPKSDIKEAMTGAKMLSFIACKNVAGLGVERIRSAIETICTYKAFNAAKSHYITAYLDPNGKLADTWIYTSDN